MVFPPDQIDAAIPTPIMKMFQGLLRWFRSGVYDMRLNSLYIGDAAAPGASYTQLRNRNDMAGTIVYNLPKTKPTVGQVLKVESVVGDGSINLHWN